MLQLNAQKRLDVGRLLAEKMPVEAIAKELGISVPRVKNIRKYLDTVLEHELSILARIARVGQLHDIARYKEALEPFCVGDVPSVRHMDRMVKLMNRECDLLGLKVHKVAQTNAEGQTLDMSKLTTEQLLAITNE